MKRQIIALSIGLGALSGPCSNATAQQPSSGELGSILACFYECKSDRGAQTWSEVTSLMIANLKSPGAILDTVILNGNGTIIARTRTRMGFEDLDEINICRTLVAGGVPAPQAGLIEILVTNAAQGTPTPEIGVFAWMKNHLGKFLQDEDEPFSERNSVKGVAKTECRVVPREVIGYGQLLEKIANVSEIRPVLIEGTGEEG